MPSHLILIITIPNLPKIVKKFPHILSQIGIFYKTNKEIAQSKLARTK